MHKNFEITFCGFCSEGSSKWTSWGWNHGVFTNDGFLSAIGITGKLTITRIYSGLWVIFRNGKVSGKWLLLTVSLPVIVIMAVFIHYQSGANCTFTACFRWRLCVQGGELSSPRSKYRNHTCQFRFFLLIIHLSWIHCLFNCLGLVIK